jgi:hypothetical protein
MAVPGDGVQHRGARGGEGRPGEAGGPVQCSTLLQGGVLVGQAEGETCAARARLELVGRPRAEGS